MSVKKHSVIIAPSILSADFNQLEKEIKDVEQSGCDWIHVDVMDGHFVPNITIGPVVIRCVRKITEIPLDVHLMIDEPERYIKDFRDAGADLITIHVEASENIKETLQAIKDLGAKCGLSLRPKTEVEELLPYLDMLDLILVMTVEPGFGGQAFMPGMLEKVKYLRSKFKGNISVDGGINSQTGSQAVHAGANVLVAGSYIFNEKNRTKVIQDLRKAVE